MGAAQECEGFVGVLGMAPDKLKKEIRANAAAELRQGVVMDSGNEACSCFHITTVHIGVLICT